MQPLPSGRRWGGFLGTALVSASVILSPGAAVAAPDTDPVRVIIELDAPTAADVVGQEEVAAARTATGSGAARARSAFAADYRAAVDSVEEAQEGVTSWLVRQDVPLDDTESVTGLLSAIVATVDPADLATLRSAPGVARVTESAPVRIYGEANIPATGAPQVWERTDGAGKPVKGDGTTVAIIDTGIDYSLADLGGGFGPGHRVVDGYDFANGDDDPMDDHMHGTHVAGIVGAGGDRLTGMAPDVSFTAWKALDANGGGTSEDVLLAIAAATDPLSDHPADVVNMSLGMTGDGTDPVGRASTAAVHQGVVVVAAAGNSGPYDQSIGSPAAAEGVIAVGAQTTGVADPTLTLDGDEPRELKVTRFPMSANPPAEGITARLVDVGEGLSEEDYEAAGDVRGAIVVMRSMTVGSLGEVQGGHLAQAELAEEHGAVGALLYMPSPSDPGADPGPQATPEILAEGGFDLRRESLVMMNMYSAEYQTFKSEVAEGTVTATIGSVDQTDTITSFSSRGPSDTMTLKPEIVAPGFEIMSDIPASLGVEGNQYRMSGTSMSSPHVAGAAALLAQAHPEQTGPQLRASLIGSAQPLESDDAEVSPSAQGAGKLDVAAAVDQHVTAAPDAVSLGLADMGPDPERTRPVVLHNSGDRSVTVRLAVRPAENSTGEAALSKRQLRIAAGRSTTVDLTVTPATGATDGETSGVVVGSVSDGSTVRVPYAAYVRPLQIQASPSLATGSTEVFVHVPMAPEANPTVEATAPSGDRSTVALRPADANVGWYRGTLPLDEPGSYRLDARATVTGRTLTGTSGVQSEGTDQPGDWEQVGFSGTARVLATSPTTPGTGLAMTSSGVNPFVTTDHGATWQRVRSMPVADGWGIPVADTATPGGFYVALNSAFGKVVADPSYRGRIVHTADAGATWTVLPFPDVAIKELVTEGDALAAVTAEGLYLSKDGGQGWSRVAPAWNGDVTDATFAGDDVLITTFDGIYRIADVVHGGDEVTQTYAGTDYTDRPQGVVADGATAVSVRGDGVALTSTDGGGTWKAGDETGQGYLTGTTFTDGTVYALGLRTYSTSSDGGATWESHPLPVNGPLATDVDHWPGTPAESVVMSMENAGYYTTEDGGESWTKTGVSGTDVSGVHVGTDGDGGTVLRATDSEGLHQRSLTDVGPESQDWGSIGREGIIGRQLSQVTQSTLGDHDVWALGSDAWGDARILTGSADSAGDDDLTRVGPGPGLGGTALALSPHDEGTVVVGYVSLVDDGIVVSRDGFETWVSYPHDIRFDQIVVDPVDENRLWLASPAGLYRSDDLGRTITRLTEEQTASVWIDPEDNDHVVVGERPGIRVSTDGGQSFTDAEVPNVSAGVDTFVATEAPDGPAAGTRLLVAGAARWQPYGLAANGAGVLVSADGGATWASASTGLTAMSVRSLSVSPDGAWLFAATDSGGVHRTAVGALVPDDLLPTATSTQIKAPATVRPLEPFAVRVTVSADDAAPSGRVTVTVAREDDRHPYERTVRLRKGHADVLVPPLLRSGDYTVTAAYEGTEDHAPSEAAATLKVTRR